MYESVTLDHVQQAIGECDELGADAFSRRYGFGKPRHYVLCQDGRAYDSKAILGAAYGYATGAALGPHEFSGGVHGAARVLRDLGFEIRNIRDTSST